MNRKVTLVTVGAVVSSLLAAPGVQAQTPAYSPARVAAITGALDGFVAAQQSFAASFYTQLGKLREQDLAAGAYSNPNAVYPAISATATEIASSPSAAAALTSTWAAAMPEITAARAVACAADGTGILAPSSCDLLLGQTRWADPSSALITRVQELKKALSDGEVTQADASAVKDLFDQPVAGDLRQAYHAQYVPAAYLSLWENFDQKLGLAKQNLLAALELKTELVAAKIAAASLNERQKIKLADQLEAAASAQEVVALGESLPALEAANTALAQARNAATEVMKQPVYLRATNAGAVAEALAAAEQVSGSVVATDLQFAATRIRAALAALDGKDAAASAVTDLYGERRQAHETLDKLPFGEAEKEQFRRQIDAASNVAQLQQLVREATFASALYSARESALTALTKLAIPAAAKTAWQEELAAAQTVAEFSAIVQQARASAKLAEGKAAALSLVGYMYLTDAAYTELVAQINAAQTEAELSLAVSAAVSRGEETASNDDFLNRVNKVAQLRELGGLTLTEQAAYANALMAAADPDQVLADVTAKSAHNLETARVVALLKLDALQVTSSKQALREQMRAATSLKQLDELLQQGYELQKTDMEAAKAAARTKVAKLVLTAADRTHLLAALEKAATISRVLTISVEAEQRAAALAAFRETLAADLQELGLSAEQLEAATAKLNLATEREEMEAVVQEAAALAGKGAAERLLRLAAHGKAEIEAMQELLPAQKVAAKQAVAAAKNAAEINQAVAAAADLAAANVVLKDEVARAEKTQQAIAFSKAVPGRQQEFLRALETAKQRLNPDNLDNSTLTGSGVTAVADALAAASTALADPTDPGTASTAEPAAPSTNTGETDTTAADEDAILAAEPQPVADEVTQPAPTETPAQAPEQNVPYWAFVLAGVLFAAIGLFGGLLSLPVGVGLPTDALVLQLRAAFGG